MTAERYEWTHNGQTRLMSAREVHELHPAYSQNVILSRMRAGARCFIDLVRAEARKPIKPSAASKKMVDGLVRVHKASRQR